jgi:hypothetical protein
MSVVTQLYFQIVEENYMFRPFSGWAIVRLRLEYRRKLCDSILVEPGIIPGVKAAGA